MKRPGGVNRGSNQETAQQTPATNQGNSNDTNRGSNHVTAQQTFAKKPGKIRQSNKSEPDWIEIWYLGGSGWERWEVRLEGNLKNQTLTRMERSYLGRGVRSIKWKQRSYLGRGFCSLKWKQRREILGQIKVRRKLLMMSTSACQALI